MGLFDNFVRLADSGLKAVENGALEKSLSGAVDKLEAGLDRAITSAEQAAAAPEKLLGTAEAKQAQLSAAARAVSRPSQHTN